MQIRSIIGFIKQPAFLLFLIIASMLWYINRLNHRYTTEIHIPITLSTDYKSDKWVEQPHIKVRCLVEGDGTRLVLYKLGLVRSIEIPMSRLVLDKDSDTDSYAYRINQSSMKRAMIANLSDLTLTQLSDTVIKIRVSDMHQVRLPIKNNIEIECRRQFTQVGEIRIQPCSIDIKAPSAILDTLRYIETRSKRYNRQNRPINESVELLIPRGVISNIHEVDYQADIAAYTEVEFILPITVKNLPDSIFTTTVVPSKVNLQARVPLRSFSNSRRYDPIAFIDYADKMTNISTMFRVQIDSLPYDVTISSITPSFVEPFFSDPR